MRNDFFLTNFFLFFSTFLTIFFQHFSQFFKTSFQEKMSASGSSKKAPAKLSSKNERLVYFMIWLSGLTKIENPEFSQFLSDIGKTCSVTLDQINFYDKFDASEDNIRMHYRGKKELTKSYQKEKKTKIDLEEKKKNKEDKKKRKLEEKSEKAMKKARLSVPAFKKSLVDLVDTDEDNDDESRSGNGEGNGEEGTYYGEEDNDGEEDMDGEEDIDGDDDTGKCVLDMIREVDNESTDASSSAKCSMHSSAHSSVHRRSLTSKFTYDEDSEVENSDDYDDVIPVYVSRNKHVPAPTKLVSTPDLATFIEIVPVIPAIPAKMVSLPVLATFIEISPAMPAKMVSSPVLATFIEIVPAMPAKTVSTPVLATFIEISPAMPAKMVSTPVLATFTGIVPVPIIAATVPVDLLCPMVPSCITQKDSAPYIINPSLDIELDSIGLDVSWFESLFD